MHTFKNYLNLIKFSHTIFALPFAIIGFVLGIENLQKNGQRHATTNILSPMSNVMHYASLFIFMLLCMIFARSAAMAFNRYIDIKFDSLNPRTQTREIPAGIISKNSALIFIITCCILFIVCTYFINLLCFKLSPIALIIILGYSYTKRFTALSHLILGLGLSLAPIGAYISVTGKFDLLPLIFSLAVICWVSGFDIIYALQDETFDASQNLHSIPVAVGKHNALLVSRLLHCISLIALIIAGYYGTFGLFYWIGFFCFAILLFYQQSIISATNLEKINIAFMTANGIASILFSVFVCFDLFIQIKKL